MAPDKLLNVGADDAQADLLRSECFPGIFQQGVGLRIAANAARINVGQLSTFGEQIADRFLIAVEDPQKTAVAAVEIVATPPETLQLPARRDPGIIAAAL